MARVNDLDSPEEIEKLLRIFYARVAIDDLLAPVFVEQARVDWAEHIPKIASFWCKLQFGTPGYQGFPTQKHIHHSELSPFRAEQFERWVTLFHDTIDSRWHGPHCDSIKARAVRIAHVQSNLIPTAEEWPGFAGR